MLPLFKSYLEESKVAVYWIRLRPKMNTTITVFNSSKPCYRLRAKVIGRNISLTKLTIKKSIKFNELREKEK